MPSIKNRQRIIAQNFISTSGLYREIVIPWQDIYTTASAVAGIGASLQTYNSGSGIFGLNFNSTSSGCFLGVSFRAPQDIAIAAPAAGSGQLYLDWMDSTGNATTAVVSASVIYVPSGSEYAAGSTSQLLGNATCKALTSASAGQNVSSSLLNFTAPTSRTGLIIVRFGRMSQAVGDSTQGNFVMFGLRLRYLADRIGS